jgi:transaldolase
MQLWLDTAKIDEIREIASWGVLEGVTTNPSLMARAGTADRKTVTRMIDEIVGGPVSAEVISTDARGMVEEAREILTWSPHVVVKIPTTAEGLKAMKEISSWPNGRINATLIFSPNQALLAAKAGASYVSIFIGRIDDVGQDGMEVVRVAARIFEIHHLEARIVAASIRHPRHVVEAALAGAHVATIPYAVMKKMIGHPLTDVGVVKFLEDWKKVAG